MKVKAGIDASIDLLISSSELFLEEFTTVVVAEPERSLKAAVSSDFTA